MALLVELTQAETDKVNEEARPAANLPKFFSSVQQKELPISRDFEAFLILLDSATKNQTVSWFKRTKELIPERKDRDEIILDMMAREFTASQERLEDVNRKLAAFNDFRVNFNAAKFGQANEVGLLLKDLQFLVDELTTTQDRLINDFIHANVLVARKRLEKITPARQKQIDSWSEVLSEY